MSVFLLFLHYSHVDVLLTPNSFCGVKCVCLQRTKNCGVLYNSSYLRSSITSSKKLCSPLYIDSFGFHNLLDFFLSFVFMVAMGLKYEIFVVYISEGNSREQRFLATEVELPG